MKLFMDLRNYYCSNKHLYLKTSNSDQHLSTETEKIRLSKSKTETKPKKTKNRFFKPKPGKPKKSFLSAGSRENHLFEKSTFTDRLLMSFF